jgi:DNA-binding MarR family transcriptional regulator
VSRQQIEQPGKPPLAHLPRELIESTGFLLGLVGSAIKATWSRELERTGFSANHFRVLVLLDEGARETQGAIADALELDRSQLVGVLDDLEQSGLVERHRDPDDRRRHVVSLTAAGRSRLATFRALVKRVEGRFLAPLDARSRSALHDLLLRLASFHDPRCVIEEGRPRTTRAASTPRR